MPRALLIYLLLAWLGPLGGAAHAAPVDPQRDFAVAMQALEAGDLERAEHLLRQLLDATGSPRVKLELARALFMQGKYAESKALFQDVSMQTDTPWRVRDNIRSFVRTIEDRTGYIKFGVSIVSDTNPRSLPAQKEFSVGGFQVTPTEAPETLTGLRYALRGWLPVSQDYRNAAYVTASYSDYPGQQIDRLNFDTGVMRQLTDSGRIRGKLGVEAGTLDGKPLYYFPYVGSDAVLAQSEKTRLTGDLKLGKVLFPDYDYLESEYVNGTASIRREVAQFAALSLSASAESSAARERPYSYSAWDLGAGIDTFWPRWTILAGARASVGSRTYEAIDPLFGERRVDHKARLEATLGNKHWRLRDNYVSLVASYEQNDSNIGFFEYRKTNLSVVVE